MDSRYLIGPIVCVLAVMFLPRKYWENELPFSGMDAHELFFDILFPLIGAAIFIGVPTYLVWRYLD